MNTILYEIREVEALIAEHERAIAERPSPSLRVSLKSLQKRLAVLEAKYTGDTPDDSIT